MTAGSAYSADPVSGRRDCVRIVSGSDFVVVEMGFARTSVRSRSGLREVDDEHSATLARLVTRVEWAVGDGQDAQAVDWSFDGQRFTLSGAHVIENLPRLTVPLAADQPQVWSNGNLSDAVAGVPTVGSWSFIAPFLRSIFFAPMTRLGYAVPPGMELVRRFEGRAYLDLSTVQAVYYDALGVPPSDTNRSLGGAGVEITLPRPDSVREESWRRNRLRLLGLLLRSQGSYSCAIVEAHAAARWAAHLDLTNWSNAQLIELSEWIGDQEAAFAPLFQIGNLAAGTWLTPLEQLVDRSLPGEGRAVAAGLMAGSGQVTSAEHGSRLVELARLAYREPAALALVNSPGDDPLAWQSLPLDSPFRAALAQFLDEFGHRGVYEAEMANPRWVEDPRFLLQQVRGHLGAPVSSMALERRRAAELALQRVPFLARPLVWWLARRARRSAALREDGKSALIAMALPARLLMLEFGRRLVRAGVIDGIDDVFHLSRTDLETFVRGEWDGSDFRALVQRRRAQREAWLAVDVAAAEQVSWTKTLRGLGAAPGRACGPARLIRHPSESGRLQRGDVLVAPSTDPGWTPLFLRTAAVVTEVGGLLSHGAIVAREYGLPAVVNVAGVLAALRDGEMVCVDGTRGVVERLR